MTKNTVTSTLLLSLLTSACVSGDWETSAADGPLTGWIPGPSGDYMKVRYEVVDGLAILDGDIILTNVLDEAPKKHQRAALVLNSNWTGGVVPYEIGTGFDATRTAQIDAAIKDWNDNTPFVLTPRTTENDYVRFVESDQCFSAIGRVGGMQDILVGEGCGTTQTTHEIGHAVGFFHEQARQDRDNFVTIDFENVQDAKKFNFDKYLSTIGEDYGPYEHESIMHYPAFIGDATFVKDTTKNTITRLDGSTYVTSGVLTGLDRAAAYRRADVSDPLKDRWLATQSDMGFALNSPLPTLDGTGRYLPTQNGRIYHYADRPSAVLIYGDILNRFLSLGEDLSPLGRPLTDELGPDSFGRFQRFQNGRMYWTPQIGAQYLLNGPLLDHYLSMGGDQSLLGYPVTDEKLFNDGADGREARFERGTITWTPFGGIKVKVIDVTIGIDPTLPGHPLCHFLPEGC